MQSFSYWLNASILLTLLACGQKQNQPADQQTEVSPANSLFQKIDANTSGISFQNEIQEDYQFNAITNPYLYNGGGVAVIDFNHDGLEDLFFTSTRNDCRLYQNKGNLKFEDVTQRSGLNTSGGNKTGVSVADINGDGWEDLYVCRTGLTDTPERANLLYVNQQNGTFKEQAAQFGLADRSPSIQAAFFDYDLDGDLDMYLLNHPSDFSKVNQVRVAQGVDGKIFREKITKIPADSDRLYRNDGVRFTDVSEASGILDNAFGLSVSVTDINKDGWPDLIVANDYVEPDFVYINKHGRFEDQAEKHFKHVANSSMGADLSDFNQDGLLDFVVMEMQPKELDRQKRLEQGTRYDRYSTLVDYGYRHQFSRNMLQINNGNQTFSDLSCIAGVDETDWSWGPLAGDFDLDGNTDLYIANGVKRDVTDLDYIKFTMDSIRQAGGLNPKRVPNINDFLNLIPSHKQRNFCFRNTGDYTFDDVSLAWGFADKTFSSGTALSDLDNDGDLDIIVSNINDPALVYRNTAADQKLGQYLNVRCVGAKPENKFAVGTKIQAKIGERIFYSEIMPVRGFLSSSTLLTQIGLGTVAKVDLLEVEFPGKQLVQMRDVPANQTLTISQADAKPGVLTQLKTGKAPMFEAVNIPAYQHTQTPGQDFVQQRLLPWRITDAGPCMAVADVDGNGLDDVYVGGGQDQPGVLYLQQSNGQWAQKSSPAFVQDKSYLDACAVFADIDSDRDLDLVVASGGAEWPIGDPRYQTRIYLNDGKGAFGKSAFSLPASAPISALLAADLDGDGTTEILQAEANTLASYPLKQSVKLYKNAGAGQFTDISQVSCGALQRLGKVHKMVLADLDGQGQPELILAGEWMPISAFRYQGNAWVNITQELGLQDTEGFWNTIELADINGDGKQDLIAGNLGLNTRYRASNEQPLSLYGADFDRNGSQDPMMCFTKDGKEYPFAFRDVIVAQIPAIKKKFIKYTDYSTASITDLFPAEAVGKAEKSVAKVLESSIFLFKNGKFERQALPNAAQVAPVYGIGVADVNGDQLPDLVLAGNDYGQQTETGRIDSGTGVVLVNQGNGTFKQIRSIDSGFWAQSEARALQVLKTKAGQQIWVANHNGPLQVYRMVRPTENAK